MKILAPLSSPKPDAIKARRQAGAQELYFGLASNAWAQQFGTYCNLNRMSDFGSRANTVDETRAASAARSIHAEGCAAFVTLNAGLYEADQLECLKELCHALAAGDAKDIGISARDHTAHSAENVKECTKARASNNTDGSDMTDENAVQSISVPDGIIVSTRALGRIVAEAGLSPVASTMLDACNADVVRALRNVGFRRIIVPREISLDEIGALTAAFPDMEFEAFLMRDGCMFSDSHCFARHLPGHGALCGSLRLSERRFLRAESARGFEAVHNSELTDELYRRFYMKRACGLCAIYRLLHMSVAAVKVVGRADNEQELLADIALVRRNLDIAKRATSEKEYLDAMEFPPDRAATCKLGLNCYYPELRFPLS